METSHHYRLVHSPSGIVVAGTVRRAANLIEENLGLLGTSKLGNDEGLWLPNTLFIHTLGMHYAIDVLFLDRQKRAVKIVPNLAPGCWLCGSWRAASCIELAAGVLNRAGSVSVGDTCLLEQGG